MILPSLRFSVSPFPIDFSSYSANCLALRFQKMLSSACFLSLPAVLQGAPLTLHSGKGVLWGFHLPRVRPEWQLLLTLLCVQRRVPLLSSITNFLLELSLAPSPSTCKSLHGFPAVNQWPPFNPHPACPAAALGTLHFPFLLETLSSPGLLAVAFLSWLFLIP